jgi:hypothetical protein
MLKGLREALGLAKPTPVDAFDDLPTIQRLSRHQEVVSDRRFAAIGWGAAVLVEATNLDPAAPLTIGSIAVSAAMSVYNLAQAHVHRQAIDTIGQAKNSL